MPQPLMPRKLKFKDSMKTYKTSSSVQFSPSVMSDSSLPHGLQHPRLGFPVQRQLPELTPKKKIYIPGDWNAKVGSQETPGVTGKSGLGVQNEAEQRLTEFCQQNALVRANNFFQQHKRQLYTWTSPDGQHWNQLDCILCSQRWTSSIQWAKTRLGADGSSDHELLTEKFRMKLKKVEKTTRPFRYDLNLIPYDYIVEVTNRFKGLDLTESLKNYGWRFVTLYRRQGSRPSPRKRMQKGKMVVWGGLTNSWEKRS